MPELLKCRVSLTDKINPRDNSVRLAIPEGGVAVFNRTLAQLHKDMGLAPDRVIELRNLGYRVEVLKGDDPEVVAVQRRLNLSKRAATPKRRTTKRRAGKRRR
jgi:hypothetical protein